MIRFLQSIQISLNDIRILISGGAIEPKNKEIRIMMKELYNINVIPHFSEDRANLKKDRDNIIKDYKKATEKAIEDGTNKLQLELHF